MNSVRLGALLTLCSPLIAQEPGDLYREWTWNPQGWQRCTGHDATVPQARLALPNPVNEINLPDFTGALRVEVQIEKLTSHTGTNTAQIRINRKAWIPIPEPAGVPGPHGVGGTSIMYNAMYYPKVDVPLSDFVTGRNKFEFSCQGAGGSGLGRVWPQFIHYGVTFRAYYDSQTHPATPTGKIVSPVSGTVFGAAHPTFEATVSPDVTSIDFLGDYDDYGWRGEERTDGWQYSRRYGQLLHHMGEVSAAPWRKVWDTTWIPTQPQPFRVVARLTTTGGYMYITEAVTGLTFARAKRVVRHRLSNIPMTWNTNYWTPTATADLVLPSDVSSREAVRMFMGTWNGIQADAIGIGNRNFATSVGRDHDMGWTQIDISRNGVQRDTNVVFTRSKVKDHGPEFVWPGIEVFIRYNQPENLAQFVTYGRGCSSSQVSPQISATGSPVLGGTYSVDLTGGAPNSTYWFILGAYHDRDRNGVPLPMHLAFMGMPNCYLNTAIHRVWSGLTDATGKASLPISIPNQPGFLRVSFYNQYMNHVPGANFIGVLSTQGGRTLIGQ